MKSLKGQLLVATPDLIDSNFFQTVILLFEHNDEGAAGVVLNRPIEANVTDIAEQVFDAPFEWDKPIHLGGPVSGPLMVLHQVPELADQEILPGQLYSTIEAHKVQEALRQRLEPSLIVANYAGWGPGQLETEISEDSWTTTPATLKLLFETDAQTLWDTASGLGPETDLIDLLDLPDVPEDPSLN
jgi:putative transcriptional regulator